MAKKNYFSNKQEPKLSKILLGICVAIAILAGISKVFFWGDSTVVAPTSAPTVRSETLDTARLRVAEGDWAGAREILSPFITKNDQQPDAPQIIMLMAEVEQAEGHPEKALELIKNAHSQFADSSYYPEIAASYAQLLEQNKKEEEALGIYQELLDNAPPEAHVPALMGMARAAERSDKLVEARDLYRKALNQAKWKSPQWHKALEQYGDLNVRLIFSPIETPESKYYAVESGDNLTNIGIKLNTTQGLLMNANNLDDPTKLRVGQRLKHTPKDFRIIIDRSACDLYLCDKDGIFKYYKIGLGMPEYQTTLGTYMIGNKQKDPTWFKPGFGAIPPNDPENELGTRWMPLVPASEGLPSDLGIHGTIAPDTIGLYKSHGCPRLLNEEVEELYDIVVRATPVEIVESATPDTIGLAS